MPAIQMPQQQPTNDLDFYKLMALGMEAQKQQAMMPYYDAHAAAVQDALAEERRKRGIRETLTGELNPQAPMSMGEEAYNTAPDSTLPLQRTPASALLTADGQPDPSKMASRALALGMSPDDAQKYQTMGTVGLQNQGMALNNAATTASQSALRTLFKGVDEGAITDATTATQALASIPGMTPDVATKVSKDMEALAGNASMKLQAKMAEDYQKDPKNFSFKDYQDKLNKNPLMVMTGRNSNALTELTNGASIVTMGNGVTAMAIPTQDAQGNFQIKTVPLYKADITTNKVTPLPVSQDDAAYISRYQALHTKEGAPTAPQAVAEKQAVESLQNYQAKTSRMGVGVSQQNADTAEATAKWGMTQGGLTFDAPPKPAIPTNSFTPQTAEDMKLRYDKAKKAGSQFLNFYNTNK